MSASARLTRAERARLEARQRDPVGFERRERAAEKERTAGRWLWASVMLARSLDTCVSILRGRQVQARLLDAEALLRALRGSPLPPPAEYLLVTAEMCDAVAEPGPFEPKGQK